MQDDLCKSRKGNDGSVIPSRHWENKGVTKRKQVRPIADFCRYQSLRPDNTDYNKSLWVYFTIRTGNEFIRMTPNCLTFYITPKVDVKETVDVANLDLKINDPFKVVSKTLSKKLNRCVYLNPLAGGPATFINEIQINLDGQLVQTNTGGHFSCTNTLNKLFCPRNVRRDALGHNHILHNELDTKSIQEWYNHGQIDLQSFIKNPDYEYTLMELNAKGADEDNPRICPVSGDIDGVLFLCKPKNLGLNSILGCDSGLNQHPILPPNTELHIRIRLNDPLQYRMIDSRMQHAMFFSDAANGTSSPPTADKFLKGKFVDIEINDITLDIEKVRPNKEKLQKSMAQGSIDFTFDQYLFRAVSLDANATTTNSKFDLPPDIGLVYVFFCRSNQLIFDVEGNRGSDLTRFAFPKTMRHVEFILDGIKILFTNGLTINRANAASQCDSVLWHKYLLHRKLTDDSFSSFFPKQLDHVTGNVGFKHAFPIDLTPYSKSKPCLLEINCSHSPKSPADFYCVLFMPQSVNIHKPSRDSIWHTSATVG